MNRNRKKIGAVAISVSALAAGTAVFASSYQSGLGFTPSDTDREFQTNQVVFDDDENSLGDKKKNNDSSELLEKDQDKKDEKTIRNQNQANYLFENNLSGDQDVLNQISNAGTDNSRGTGTGLLPAGNGTIYDITGDPSDADTIISGGNLNGNGSTGNNQGQTSGDENNQSGNNNGNGNGSDSTDQDHRNPSVAIKDPDFGKTTPTDPFGSSKPYTEDMTPWGEQDETGDFIGVIIQQPYSTYRNFLYMGQEVDAKKLYYALETYVRGSDGSLYIWGADALDRYIRVEGVSFDGGKTWISQFPVTIPTDFNREEMYIRVSYRLSEKSNSWIRRDVNYIPEKNSVYILSERLTEEMETIPEDAIIENLHDTSLTSKINLLRYQESYLGSGSLDQLFPGWLDEGKLVPWFYEASAGRHILEPADFVDLEPGYTAKVSLQWMTEDYGTDGSNLCYLQTLTGFDESVLQTVNVNEKKLVVPKYIQSVDFDGTEECEVDQLQIPDTVLFIDIEAVGADVKKKYLVSSDNLCYSATKEGLLMNKEQTKILGVPSQMENLTVPEDVTSVKLFSKNRLKTVTIEAGSADELPDIDYTRLKDCTILVHEDLLDAFLEQNSEEFTDGMCVAAIEDPKITYTVENGCIISNSGVLRKVLPTTNTSLIFSGRVRSVQEGAFTGADQIQKMILAKDGTVVHFSEGSLSDVTALNYIFCYTQEQYDSVTKELEAAGAVDGVRVEMLQRSEEGFSYAAIMENDVEKSVLIDAPGTLTEFDGTVTAADGTPVTLTEIGPQAFAECKDLQWVVLPESVEKIGYQAFLNCTSLQGIMINAEEQITIGNKSLDGCTSLRFVASNAMLGIMEDDYDPIITDRYANAVNLTRYFFVPTDSLGYTENSVSFTEASGVYSYRLIDCGADERMLYGTDEDGTPWLLLRAGTKAGSEVELPATTREIFDYALADVESSTGKYTVNWEDLTQLKYIGRSSFRNSDLGGDFEYNVDEYVLYEYAFAGCENLTSVQLEGQNGKMLEAVFQHCPNLKTALIQDLKEGEALYPGVFTGCEALTDITFGNETAPSLTVYNEVFFQFNADWTLEEEAERLRVHVPEGCEKNYIMGWRYGYCGYYPFGDYSLYLNMWETIQSENINWDTWEFPTDEEVDAILEETLLKSENQIRRILGMKQTEELTDFYPYRLRDTGLTLIDAPTYITEVRLDAGTLDMPFGWYLDYIGTGAFSRSRNLRKVTILDNLAGIETNAFAGTESDALTLEFEGTEPPQLLGGSADEPFSFGVEDSRLHIEVPEGSEEIYLEQWKYPLAGYTDLEEMQTKIREELTENAEGTEPTEKEISAEIEKRLLPVENRLRAMLGMGLAGSEETAEQTAGRANAVETAETAGKADTAGDAGATGKAEEEKTTEAAGAEAEKEPAGRVKESLAEQTGTSENQKKDSGKVIEEGAEEKERNGQ